MPIPEYVYSPIRSRLSLLSMRGCRSLDFILFTQKFTVWYMKSGSEDLRQAKWGGEVTLLRRNDGFERVRKAKRFFPLRNFNVERVNSKKGMRKGKKTWALCLHLALGKSGTYLAKWWDLGKKAHSAGRLNWMI
ncbi:hypothetical protein TWF970_001395 [Orbilia oligospora]|uniref:Uncharacterized protein n=1 Tax=Orbilia oligospora TaxID=2813651 RepID=A0A7C8RHC5_ORBOL|nr:hypothetical protein TWF970_001395 [Orbilia oligospora]